VVDLDVLPRGDVAFVERRELLDHVGERVHLVRRDPAHRQLDPDHLDVGLALAVDALLEAKAYELVLGCVAGEELLGLVVEVVELALDDRDDVAGDIAIGLRVLQSPGAALAPLLLLLLPRPDPSAKWKVFTVLMCADCQAARGHGSAPYPVMTRSELRAGLDTLSTWALEQKAVANRQLIAATRRRLAPGEQVARMYQEPGAGLAGAASRGRRRAGGAAEANCGRLPRIMTTRVGRLELHVACLRRPRSGGFRSSDLRF